MSKLLSREKIRNSLVELVERIDHDTGEPFWRVNVESPGRRVSIPYSDILEAKKAYSDILEAKKRMSKT
ncbi:hypothetical protein JC221_109 [Yersinia phage JC221]|nr:hypothetical protein JC221_109 [Yersinia phage JC221]